MGASKHYDFNLERFKHRFIGIFIFLFLAYNPSGVSVYALLTSETVPFQYRFTLTVVVATVLIVLLRHTYTAMRMAGTLIVLLLLMAVASFLWFLQDWILLDERVRYFISLMTLTSVLTFGQILPLAIRQLSGQKAVLKNPP